MSSQQEGFGILGLKHFLNQVSPQPPPSSQLCYFHVEVHANSPEEREPVIGEHAQNITLNHSNNSGSITEEPYSKVPLINALSQMMGMFLLPCMCKNTEFDIKLYRGFTKSEFYICKFLELT